jgi:NAD(P)-dependent dehydrogenase (short-subunit alcohol dehydrogenase family)
MAVAIAIPARRSGFEQIVWGTTVRDNSGEGIIMKSEPNRGSILITGASTGIGKATAVKLAQDGFQVFATVRQERDGSKLQAEASERLTPVLMDVTEEASIFRARETICQLMADGGLAGLVNNAGVGFTAPLEFVPLDDLRWLFEVNFFGLLAVTQAFLPLLRQAHGRIVNVSSIASLMHAPFHGPYTASKLSLNGLSNCMRLELRPLDVSVSLIICGIIRTPIWKKGRETAMGVGKEFPAQAMAIYGEPFRRLGEYFSARGEQGHPPEIVARTITHALTAKRPRQTYFVGPGARLHNVSNKLLYGRLRDWVILRTIGIGRAS